MRQKIGDPQREQNARCCPGEDSNSRTNSAPERIWNSELRTDAFAANAEPEARRHWEQWQ